MPDNEKLIEEAAEAIRDAHEASRGYLSEGQPHSDSRLYARLALEVFEKALGEAEKPEWEYGVRLHKPLLPPKLGDNIGSGGAVVPTTPHRTLKAAEHMAELNPSYIPTYFTRRPAGPWLPVEN